MCDIEIGRYDHPESVKYQGWITPKDGSWIVFVDLEGNPRIFLL